MKSAIAVIISLSLVWVCCVSAAGYSSSLSDWFNGAVDEGSAVIDSGRQSLDSAMQYGASEAPTVAVLDTAGLEIPMRLIDPDGSISDATTSLPIEQPSTVGLEFENNGNPTRKIAQLLPQSRVVASPDGSTIMQVSPSNPVLQVYYGYQQSASHPFTYLYKVDTLEDGVTCQSARIEFSTRSMALSRMECVNLETILQGSEIPQWGDLP